MVRFLSCTTSHSDNPVRNLQVDDPVCVWCLVIRPILGWFVFAALPNRKRELSHKGCQASSMGSRSWSVGCVQWLVFCVSFARVLFVRFVRLFARFACFFSQPCQQEEGLPFIRLTNAGEEVLGFRTQGFLCARIMQVRTRFTHCAVPHRAVIDCPTFFRSSCRSLLCRTVPSCAALRYLAFLHCSVNTPPYLRTLLSRSSQ